MPPTFRVRSAVMIVIILMVLSITTVLYVEALPEMTRKSADQAQESNTSTDWFGVFCCLLVMLVTIGFPIAIIVFITKIIQGAGKKKETDIKWKGQRPYNRNMKPTGSARIDISRGQKRYNPINDPLKKPPEKKKWPKEEWPGMKRRKEPEVEKEIIEMDLLRSEFEDEPEMPVFERPQALSDQKKDEFIVERIMELQGMLKDGEIDKEMYDQLKTRLMDQLED